MFNILAAFQGTLPSCHHSRDGGGVTVPVGNVWHARSKRRAAPPAEHVAILLSLAVGCWTRLDPGIGRFECELSDGYCACGKRVGWER